MQLGLELRRMDRLAESFDAYAKALNLAETQPNQIITDEVRETLLTQYSGYLLADKQYEKVLEVLTSDLAMRQPLTPGQLLVRGRALIHLRQPRYALKDVQEAYSRREETTLFPSAIDANGMDAVLLRAEAMYLNQNPQKAIELIDASFQAKSWDINIVRLYAQCLDAASQPLAALKLLRDHAFNRLNTPDIWIQGAVIATRHNGFEHTAKEWIREALSYFPSNDQLNNLSSNRPEAQINKHGAFPEKMFKSAKKLLNDSADSCQSPKTTVICAVWHKDQNRDQLLRAHRENLARQSRAVEIIYVFDGGDRPSIDLKARTVTVDECLTIYQAWNVALSLVTTPYVLNLNLDDRLNFDAVEIMEKIINEDVSIGLIGGDWKICFDQESTDCVRKCYPATVHEVTVDWPPVLNRTTRLGSGDGNRGTYGPACMWRMDLHRFLPRYPWRLNNGEKIKVVSDAVWWSTIKTKTNYKLHRQNLIIGNYHSHPDVQAEFRYKDSDEIGLVNSIGVSIL
jgi:tetratricopeptide (TPR) repeat protein